MGTLQNTLLSMNASAVVCIVAMLCVGLVEAKYRSFATAAVVDAVSAEVLELQAKLRPSHARFLAELVSVLSPRSKVRRAGWRPAGGSHATGTHRVLTGTHGRPGVLGEYSTWNWPALAALEGPASPGGAGARAAASPWLSL